MMTPGHCLVNRPISVLRSPPLIRRPMQGQLVGSVLPNSVCLRAAIRAIGLFGMQFLGVLTEVGRAIFDSCN